MLHAGHDVVLHAGGERGAHFAEMERVLAIRLLRPAPRRVAEEVDADAAEIVAAERANFAADDIADACFEFWIEGRAARHRHRECRRTVHDHAAWPVDEANAGDTETRYGAGNPELTAVALRRRHLRKAAPKRQVAIHEAELLVEGELAEEIVGPLRDRGGGKGRLRFECAERG